MRLLTAPGSVVQAVRAAAAGVGRGREPQITPPVAPARLPDWQSFPVCPAVMMLWAGLQGRFEHLLCRSMLHTVYSTVVVLAFIGLPSGPRLVKGPDQPHVATSPLS